MAKRWAALSTRQVGECLNQGLAHHRAGKFGEALACYAAILRVLPAHADALHLSGLIARERGDLLASERLITQAIRSRSTVSAFHYNLGNTLELLGKRREAVESYRRALSLDPQNLPALQRIDCAIGEQADPAEVIALYEAFLKLSPDSAEAHYDLGRLHQRRGDLSNAVTCYRKAIALQPACFEFHFNLAAMLFQTGHFADAAESYRQAILLRPEDAEAHYSLGVVLQTLKDENAFTCYRKAIALQPACFEFHFNLAAMLFQTGHFADAAESYRQATLLRPEHAGAHYSLGVVLQTLKDESSAMQAYISALRINPDLPQALSNLGGLCVDRDDPQAGEGLLRRSIALDPSNASAHCNLANALAKLGNIAGALGSSRNALALDPTSALTLCNLGAHLESFGDAAGAMQCYQAALAAHPDSQLAQYYVGLQHLLSGNFAAGWQGYESRWATPDFRNMRPEILPPQWHGEDIRGSRILLYHEQGLGDTLQFVRYVPRVAALGATVLLKVQPPLVRLLSWFHRAIAVVSTESDEGNDAEWSCPLLSLPRVFGTNLENIPQDVPYLLADPMETHAWAQRLAAHGLRVGLVWAGNPKHARDRLRSIALEQLGRLTRMQGATFYSLQKGPASTDLVSSPLPIIDLSEHLEDFAVTAAIIAKLDLVICVDTAVAHLAGAMGKPVWLLVAHVGDWRWLKDRTDSPWYPTMRLFRQQATGRWDDVLEQVAWELEAMANAGQPPSPAFAVPQTSAPALHA
ncbi:MAG: tetratricopeptide repeat protein [Acidobacteriaceae bacterium]